MKIKKWLIVFAILGFFVVAAITFSGCDGGNPTEPSGGYKQLIIGSWEVRNGPDRYVETYYEDGTWVLNFSTNSPLKGTWRIEGDKLIISALSKKRRIKTLNQEKMELEILANGSVLGIKEFWRI